MFQNDRVTVFRPDGPPEGENRIPVTVGDEFETDVLHGKELARLGHAEPIGWSVDDVENPLLEPHHQVSATQLHLDGLARGEKLDTPNAAAVQSNRADGGKPVAKVEATQKPVKPA